MGWVFGYMLRHQCCQRPDSVTHMESVGLRSLYDQQLRTQAEVVDAAEVTRLGPLWLATYPARQRGLVTYRRLPQSENLDGLICGAVSHYEADARITHFEWKTRGHDAPPDLLDRLAAHGFVLESAETVMAGVVASAIAADATLPGGYDLIRAETESQVREAEALASRVFGDSRERSTRQADELVQRFRSAPESFEMWFVRAPSGAVVCSGRVDFVDGTDFAGLWGGACDPAHRGKGLYRALAAARARSAAARSKLYLHVDCTEFSRPILQRAGLVPITTSTPAIWNRTTT